MVINGNEQGEINMGNKKYPAIYTDNLGCEKAYIYAKNKRLYLKVRNIMFFTEEYGFDFYNIDNCDAGKKFWIKDNELIGYVLDIQIPVTIEVNNKKVNKKFILRLERQKNYYNNSLVYEEKQVHNVHGYSFKELLEKMKNELTKEFNFKIEKLYAISG